MNEEKPNYFSIIPANVRYDKELKANEKLLYGEITSLSNKEGYCYATNKYFAELYDVSIQTISTWINNLVDKGYITSEMVYKENTNEIAYRKLSTLFKKTLIGIKENLKGGIKENLKANNTSNIIINNNNSNNIVYDNIYSIYEEEIGVLSPRQYEILNEYSKLLPDELICEAIRITKDNGASNFNYLKAILNDFINKGYKKISDINRSVKRNNKNVKDVPTWFNYKIESEEIDEDELINLENDFKMFD